MPDAIRARDERMTPVRVANVGVPYHPPSIVDPGSVASVSTECAEIGCFLAVKVNDKRRKPLGEGGRCEPTSIRKRSPQKPNHRIQKSSTAASRTSSAPSTPEIGESRDWGQRLSHIWIQIKVELCQYGDYIL